jgi:glycine cleavage system H protein
MSVPVDRRYLETHEWHQLVGDVVTIGLTQHAADELTDITFVQLPKVGTAVAAGKPFGEIESVKATADLMAGVSGQVVGVNDALTSNPGLVNQDPFAAGWMIKVKVTDTAQVQKLLSAEDYQKKSGH